MGESFATVYKKFKNTNLYDCDLWNGHDNKKLGTQNVENDLYIIDYGRPSCMNGLIYNIRDEVTTINKHDAYNGPVYGLRGYPGVLVLPGVIGTQLQRELAINALFRYTEEFNYTNIDSNNHQKWDKWIQENRNNKLQIQDSESLWNQWKIKNQQNIYNFIENKGYTVNEDGIDMDVHNMYEGNAGVNTPIKHGERGYIRELDNIRWSTLGFHYNWTERSYDDQYKSIMPNEISNLTEYIYKGLDGIIETSDYRCEAVIVNYYKDKSCMGGHRDDLEYDFSKPLFSYSIGCNSIFILGGSNSKDEPGIPILLRSGDCFIMNGHSRLRYHGISRIIQQEEWYKLNLYQNIQVESRILDSMDRFVISSIKQIMLNDKSHNGYIYQDGETFKYCTKSNDEYAMGKSDPYALEFYLSTHRININVRHVIPTHLSTIHECKQYYNR